MASYFGGFNPQLKNLYNTNRAIRTVTRRRSRESCRSSFKELKLLPHNI
jgi:hypothetical protein